MNIYQNEQNIEDDSPIEITLEQLEDLRNDCKELIETAKAAVELRQDKNFQKVVQIAYVEKEPKRLGGLIASGLMPESSVNGAISDLKSIGNFVTFFNDVIQKGRIAQSELDAAEEAYEESLLIKE